MQNSWPSSFALSARWVPVPTWPINMHNLSASKAAKSDIRKKYTVRVKYFTSSQLERHNGIVFSLATQLSIVPSLNKRSGDELQKVLGYSTPRLGSPVYALTKMCCYSMCRPSPWYETLVLFSGRWTATNPGENTFVHVLYVALELQTAGFFCFLIWQLACICQPLNWVYMTQVGHSIQLVTLNYRGGRGQSAVRGNEARLRYSK